MKTLAIHWSTCSTAAVHIDGETIAVASEERFSRRKNDERYPKHAIEAVLRTAGIDAAELDAIAFAGNEFDAKYVLTHKFSGYSVSDRLREEREYWYPRLYEGKQPSYFDVFRDKVDLDQYPGGWQPLVDALENGSRAEFLELSRQFRVRAVTSHLGTNPANIRFIDHHLCHAQYAYFGSPLRGTDVAVLTADAYGDGVNAAVWRRHGSELQRVAATGEFNLARLYRSMTLLLGMKPDEHEYKVMGLAAYAKPDYYQDALRIFADTMYVDGLAFGYHNRPKDLYEHFKRSLEGMRFDSIAGALQQYTEDILTTWAGNAMLALNARRLCIGGGVAMNVKAMLSVASLAAVDELFICPSPADESLPIGAGYAVEYETCLAQGRDADTALRPLANAYLGPDLDRSEAQDVARRSADRCGHRIIQDVEPAYVAASLARGLIVGRAIGRSEFGARALGNRSILGDPRNTDTVKKINERVKGRDFWMPFAPVMLERRAVNYLRNPKGLKAPFMTLAFATTPLAWSELRAGLHQADLTCRPQVLAPGVNDGYEALLTAFENQCGVGGLLNTSFNMHGEPIVQTAADAVDVFERSNLDLLLLPGIALEKAQTDAADHLKG